MALPVGVLSAIYVSEFADQRVARGIKLALDVLNGLPSIVIGIFLFALLVVGRGQNGFIGSIALAIIMLPLVSRSTQEVLALVPNHLREGSLALGVSKWRTILGVILPTTFSGILTGHDARGRPCSGGDGAAALHDARSSATWCPATSTRRWRRSR